MTTPDYAGKVHLTLYEITATDILRISALMRQDAKGSESRRGGGGSAAVYRGSPARVAAPSARGAMTGNGAVQRGRPFRP